MKNYDEDQKLNELISMWPFNLAKRILIYKEDVFRILILEFENVIKEALPEKSFNMLIDRYKTGLTIAEISKKYDITIPGVRSKIDSSIRRLQKPSILCQLYAVSEIELKEVKNEMKLIRKYNDKLLHELKTIHNVSIEPPNDILSIDIRNTSMNTKIILAISRHNSFSWHDMDKISTLGDLTEITLKDFKKIRGIGEVACNECIEILNKYGLKFKEE